MMQKIQRFGGAMYTPAILFAFSGIVVGLGTLFTTEAIFGEMATAGHLWFDCWNVLLQGGWTLFNQMPLLFCVALPISLANKQNARCCMEALAIYLTFNYFVSTILGQWGPVFGVDYSVEAGSGTGLATIASIKTLDMGIMGALIISGIATMLHNKYFDTELPEWLGVFSGSVFIYMIGFFVMVPVAIIACLVWPHVQAAISAFQGFILSAGTFGVGVFAFIKRVLVTTLTKRMAEDLTEYLEEHGERVRYLHSDIDTVERMEIIRDLRLGEFDVLVGINLLREGLDMPEVSLVAILDADKEGFLRSERSLIQTIGRAARNVNGKAILYGDKITPSMAKAIGETERRREKQQRYNEEHGIVPQGLNKKVVDILQLGQGLAKTKAKGRGKAKAVEPAGLSAVDMTPKALQQKIHELEGQMMQHAQNLEFEEAAQIRDQLHQLRELFIAAS